MPAAGDCTHAQLGALATLARPPNCLQCANGNIAPFRLNRCWGATMSIWVFGLLPLATSSKPWQRSDTEISLAPAAVLVTACGVGQRSGTQEKKFLMFKFSFALGIEHMKYTKISRYTIIPFPTSGHSITDLYHLREVMQAHHCNIHTIKT